MDGIPAMAAVKLYRFVSRGGLALCGGYLVIAGACIVLGMAARTTGSKANFVFLQLPIALQLALAEKLGFSPWLRHIGWVEGYLVFGLPMLPILYTIGWLLNHYRDRNSGTAPCP